MLSGIQFGPKRCSAVPKPACWTRTIMIGDCFKGIFLVAFIGFALLGVATVIPESVWDRAPEQLLPLRAYLADRGVISEKYASPLEHAAPAPEGTAAAAAQTETDSALECEGGVCRVRERGDTAAPREERPNFVPMAAVDTLPAQPAAPIREEIPAPSRLPDDPPQSVEPREEPAFVPENGLTDPGFGDTLPDLGFGDNPFPDEEFPAVEPKADPVVRGAAQEGQFDQPSREKTSPQASPIKAVSHVEQENALPREPISAGAAAQDELHERIASLVARSEGAGAISAAFLGLNDVLDKHDAELTPADRELVNKTLDRLAYRVFYQPGEFVLWEEYNAASGETLASIARDHKITPEFLAAINSLHVRPDDPLPAGQSLKVVNGPVSADVSFSKMELLLKFNGLYAGRFKMGCAQRAAQIRGEFPVERKIKNPEYNGPLDNGQIGRIAGGDPNNPLGPCWIELEGGLGLQGTNHPDYVGRQTAGVGGLIFSNKDITHLNILLSQGSVVRIAD